MVKKDGLDQDSRSGRDVDPFLKEFQEPCLSPSEIVCPFNHHGPTGRIRASGSQFALQARIDEAIAMARRRNQGIDALHRYQPQSISHHTYLPE